MTSSISGTGGGFSVAALKQMQEDLFKSVDSSGDNKIDKNEMSAFQQSQKSKGRQGGPGVEEMFKSMDSDSDGAINRLESDASIAKLSQEMQDSEAKKNSATDLKDDVFKAGDRNGDGSISKDELNLLLSNSNRKDTTADDIMSALDSNKDGSISKNESDAVVDKAGQQRRAQGPPPPPPPSDSSSSSSGKSRSTAIFDDLDTNKDGTVSASELLAALSNSDDSSSESSSSDSASSSSASVDSSSVKMLFDAMDTNQDGSVSKSELEAALEKTGKQHHSKVSVGSNDSTSATNSANSTDSSLFATAAKSYLAASFGNMSQNSAISTLSASVLYA